MATIHQLHHRPELDDIRYAYDSDRSYHSDVDSDQSYQRSQFGSDRSDQTAPTVYSSRSARRPARTQHIPCYDAKSQQEPRFFPDRQPEENPRASIETYTSTVPDEEEGQDIPEYDVPDYTGPHKGTATPATPSDFSELFPSSRTLKLRHDDSTLDGNMNLRVDTEVTMHGGRICDMTLFHLRMHDLRDRDFSLRRYCRDSGREVCHSSRRQSKPVIPKRPGFQRSLSNALNSMRSKSDPKSATLASLKRNDSGYGSMHSSIDFDRDDSQRSTGTTAKPQHETTSNSIKLEFSNYAQIEVKRVGAKGSKRYEFEYWGTHYNWRRVVRNHDNTRDVSFHLTKSGGDQALAYIVQSPLTPAQRAEETSKGGWVPPSSMWLADDDLVRGAKDVADAVIASGLIALVDDCINTRFNSKGAKHIVIPTLGQIEYIGPKRLINEMFKRDSTGHQSRQSSMSRPSSSGGATRKATDAVRHSSHEY